MSEHIGLPSHGENTGLSEPIRQREHQWALILSHEGDSGSIDTVDACTACGTVRHTYTVNGVPIAGYPHYFGNFAQHMTYPRPDGSMGLGDFWGTSEELPCRITEW